MLQSIIVYGLALGAIYGIVGIAYNVTYLSSRVLSFATGSVGMLGGVFGALFVMHMGWNPILGLLATLILCAVIGLLIEFIAVRPVLHLIDQHLYILSTLAAALIIQQLTSLYWSTEPEPFPRLLNIGSGIYHEKLWLPVVACIVVYVGLEFLYRKTVLGLAFVAVSEDNYAARAMGLPETQLRMMSFAMSCMIAGLAGFVGAQILFAFVGNAYILTFFGFIPVALGSVGSNRGAVVAGFALGLFQQAANFLFGGIFANVVIFSVFIVSMLVMPNGFFGARNERRV